MGLVVAFGILLAVAIVGGKIFDIEDWDIKDRKRR